MHAIQGRKSSSRFLAGAATLALSVAALAAPAHAVVPNDNVTPEEAVDSEDRYRGVGMFFRTDGFVCSGTLINPRTVLFAAHCVNDRPETDYDMAIRSAWSFNVDALPGFIDWIGGFQSNPELAVYNVNRIYWNAQSTESPQSQGFLEGDIAIASLDTPATGIPIWSLLFSPLPTPGEITDQDGTGYHVDITGYGRSGSGTVGANLSVDWRRRAAENMLGALTSFDERNTFLFGPGPSTLPQSLYRLDFDDPNQSNPFDFNLWKDEPRENEGTTAGGDSGGPLILDAANNSLFDQDLVIGVLSGGSRFFGPQAFSSYGTESYYQPLYLYWDYIVANSPYRYVTAQAGDGDWEDAGHWVTTLDPAFMIINEDGEVVNGLPTSPGAGRVGESPDFGEVCFDPQGDNPGDVCQDVSDGSFTPPARNAVGIELTSGIGTVNVGDLGLAPDDASTPERVTSLDGLDLELAVQPQGASGGEPEFAAGPNPEPTLANGLPGATGFVPDNVDPIIDADPGINVDPRYYDVTLGAAGTTRLNSTVTIDKLTVRGPAGLYIAPAGNLTSLIDVNQFGGSVNIDGSLTSVGDYTLFAGFLGGNGTLDAPFVTSIMGAISPGGTGSIGTFTIDGNAVLSSGSTLLVDIGPNGASDNLQVTGEANVGGLVAIGSGIFNVVNGNGQQYEIVTADGGVTGTFTDGTISAILSQSFTYEANRVLMSIDAASYLTVVDANDPVQVAYAGLLDAERGNAELSELYGLDFANAGTIQGTLNGLAPTTETAVRTLTAQTLSHLMTFHDGRLRTSSKANNGGTVATIGRPLEAAELGLASRMSQPLSGPLLGLQGSDEDVSVSSSMSVPDSLALYIGGGFMNGEGDSMPGFTATETDFDGYYVAGGVEWFPNDSSMLGASVYHSSLDADVALGHTADSMIWAGSFYGRTRTKGGLVFDAQASVSGIETETVRNVSYVGSDQTLTAEGNTTALSAAVGVSYEAKLGGATLSPGIDLRYSDVDFGTVTESGGFAALRIERPSYESLQGRAGLELRTNSESAFQLSANGHYVHEFEDGPQLFNAGFARGTSAPTGFALAGDDRDWVELGVEARFGSGPVQLGVGVDTTIGRDNADTQVYSASASVRF